jgi:DNA repair exonuclease SbcCD ATPase subunit
MDFNLKVDCDSLEYHKDLLSKSLEDLIGYEISYFQYYVKVQLLEYMDTVESLEDICGKSKIEVSRMMEEIDQKENELEKERNSHKIVSEKVKELERQINKCRIEQNETIKKYDKEIDKLRNQSVELNEVLNETKSENENLKEELEDKRKIIEEKEENYKLVIENLEKNIQQLTEVNQKLGNESSEKDDQTRMINLEVDELKTQLNSMTKNETIMESLTYESQDERQSLIYVIIILIVTVIVLLITLIYIKLQQRIAMNHLQKSEKEHLITDLTGFLPFIPNYSLESPPPSVTNSVSFF